MQPPLNRREFLATSAGLAAGLSAAASGAAQTQTGRRGGGGQQAAAPAAPLTFRTKPHKALIARPTEEDLKQLKAAGFEGVEGNRNVQPDEAAKTRAIAEKMGMRIHSVLYGWAEFNNTRQEAERTFAEVEAALKTAQAFGADAVLLVPCRIPPSPPQGSRGARGTRGGGATTPSAAASTQAAQPALRMPRAWEFQIEFNEKNGHITRVAYGDNAPYADYIKAHNHATDTSKAWIRRLIPLAQKTKVMLAIENVGNNLWVQPKIFRHFVQSFQSPWVKAYYDIGNHVRFAPPEEWILTLSDLLVKIHVKDYLLDPADPAGRGRGVNIREGSVRWPVLRQALEAVNYNGWMTIEGSGSVPIEERSKRLDMILAGV